MSDIKTLREAICVIPGAGMLSGVERAALAILCRREVERMEREFGNGDHWTKAQIDKRDKVIADNAWNAALQAGIDYIKEVVGDVATEKLNAFEIYAALNALRREPRT